MDNSQQSVPPQTAKIVERNIEALLHRTKEQIKKRSVQHKVVNAITTFAGSMLSVYIHLLVFGIWIIWNLGLLKLKPFDPSFIILATFAAVEAIFLSIFILMSQNHLTKEQDKRAELDLQISLLAEHEVTHILKMLSAIAKKMGLDDIVDQDIIELSQDIQPEKVMDEMESAKKANEGKV